MCGFLKLGFLIYNAAYPFTGLRIDATVDDYPSCVRSGICGEGADHQCPSADGPIDLWGGPPSRL